MMALSAQDQAKIREYLLRKLSDAEQEEIEERLMVEDKLFEELEIAKGELIEEYRDGELTPKERESFKDGFLSTLEGRKQQAFSVAVGCVAQQHRQPEPVGVFQSIAAFFRQQQWAFPALASAA